MAKKKSKDKLLELRKNILSFSYWDCKFCGEKIDAGSRVGNDEDKTRILVEHIKDRHFDENNIDPNLADENLVLYFKGQYVQKPTTNVKLNDIILHKNITT